MASDGPSFLECFIVAAALGTAIGNMFVVRRLRSISKFKPPFDPMEKIKQKNQQSFYNKGEQEMCENLKKFQLKQNEIVMKKKVLTKWYISNCDSRHRPSVNYLPEYYTKHLEVLQLPLNQYPSKAEIKEAWRKYAMIQHPDAANNIHKEVDNIKFRDGNDRYKELLSHVDSEWVNYHGKRTE